MIPSLGSCFAVRLFGDFAAECGHKRHDFSQPLGPQGFVVAAATATAAGVVVGAAAFVAASAGIAEFYLLQGDYKPIISANLHAAPSLPQPDQHIT